MCIRLPVLSHLALGSAVVSLLAACPAGAVGQDLRTEIEKQKQPVLLPPLEIASVGVAEDQSIVVAKQSVPGPGGHLDILVCIPRDSKTPLDAKAKFIVELRDGQRVYFSITVDSDVDHDDPSHERVAFAVGEGEFDQLRVDLLYVDSVGYVIRSEFRWLYMINMGPILRAIEDEDLERVLETRCASREKPTRVP